MNRLQVSWIAVFTAVLIWSGIAPHDRITWWLEVAPVLVGALIGTLTYSSFRLSPLLYRLESSQDHGLEKLIMRTKVVVDQGGIDVRLASHSAQRNSAYIRVCEQLFSCIEKLCSGISPHGWYHN